MITIGATLIGAGIVGPLAYRILTPHWPWQTCSGCYRSVGRHRR